MHSFLGYFFFACASAEPAADLDAVLVRPSLNTAEAVLAAFGEVILDGATCDKALPAALFDGLPVDVLDKTEDDLLATLELVTFLVIVCLRNKLFIHTVSVLSRFCKHGIVEPQVCFRSS